MTTNALITWVGRAAITLVFTGLLWWAQNLTDELRELRRDFHDFHDFHFVQGQVLQRLKHLEARRSFYGEQSGGTAR